MLYKMYVSIKNENSKVYITLYVTSIKCNNNVTFLCKIQVSSYKVTRLQWKVTSETEICPLMGYFMGKHGSVSEF